MGRTGTTADSGGCEGGLFTIPSLPTRTDIDSIVGGAREGPSINNDNNLPIFSVLRMTEGGCE